MVPGLELLRDEVRRRVAELVPELAADIGSYRVIERRPLEAAFGGMRVVTCPPPSLGGADRRRGTRRDRRLGAGRARRRSQCARVGALAPATSGGRSDSLRSRGRPTSRCSTGTATRPRSRRRSGPARACSPHGFQLNNMLGELDVIGTRGAAIRRAAAEHDGADDRARRRPSPASSSAAPARSGSRGRSCRRSTTSSRAAFRSARRSTIRDSTSRTGSCRSRVAGRRRRREQLQQAGQRVNPWAGRNLYFGGVSAVERRPDGQLAAAGDPRRGGHGVVVP